MIHIICQALEECGKFDDAIKIYKKINGVEFQNRCFSRMIENSKTIKSKFYLQKLYGEFLENHGRHEKALEIYQSMID